MSDDAEAPQDGRRMGGSGPRVRRHAAEQQIRDDDDGYRWVSRDRHDRPTLQVNLVTGGYLRVSYADELPHWV